MLAEILALDLDAAKRIGLFVVGGAVVLTVLVGIVVKQVLVKLVTMLLLLGVAFVAWSQRDGLVDCASKVRSRVEALDDLVVPTTTVPGAVVTTVPAASGAPTVGTCHLFGQDVDIPGPEPTGPTTPTTPTSVA